MAKVRVHLEDIIGLVLDSPLETADIRCTESEFTGALHDEQAVLELTCHQFFDDISCAVGRAVVDDEYVELQRQFHDSRDDGFDVFLLVVSRDND